MILELLGIGILGAIGKSIYDEAKQENSQSNSSQSYSSQDNKSADAENSRYWNIIYDYARKYQHRKSELSDDIWNEIQFKTKRDLFQIKADYKKAQNKIANKSNNTSTHSTRITSETKGEIRQLELSSHIGTVIDDNGAIYDIIFTQNTFRNFPNGNPKVNDSVLFTKQYVNGRLCASDIKYFKKDDDFANVRTREPSNDSSNSNHAVKSETTHNFSKRTNETSKSNDNPKSTEELIMQKINSLPRTFDYSSTTLNNNALFGGCVTMLADILDSVVSSNNVNQLKLTLSAKKQRYNSTTEYNKCLENNIVFELYKYDNFIKIFNIFDSDMNNLNKMNYQTFCMIMLNDSKKNVSSAKQLAQNNSFIRNLLVNYSYKDTENREFDYIFSSLKVSVIALAMQSVLYGYIEISDKRISGKEFFKHFSSKNNIAALDTVITQGIANRLSKLY